MHHPTDIFPFDFSHPYRPLTFLDSRRRLTMILTNDRGATDSLTGSLIRAHLFLFSNNLSTPPHIIHSIIHNIFTHSQSAQRHQSIQTSETETFSLYFYDPNSSSLIQPHNRFIMILYHIISLSIVTPHITHRMVSYNLLLGCSFCCCPCQFFFLRLYLFFLVSVPASLFYVHSKHSLTLFTGVLDLS